MRRLGTNQGWGIATGYNDGDPENDFAWVGDAVFSPDGSKVAFTASRDTLASRESGIFVKNSNGTREAEWIIDGGFEPDWQPLQP